jgi:hypothetical protein
MRLGEGTALLTTRQETNVVGMQMWTIDTQDVSCVGVGDSSNYWLAPLLDLGSPGFEPWSGLSFLFLQVGYMYGN